MNTVLSRHTGLALLQLLWEKHMVLPMGKMNLDLILTYGMNDQLGYVRRDDLRAKRPDSILIPVYDLDGVVIDMFFVEVVR